VSIDNVTCLVGKNESGKTAFLQALRRLNPVSSADADFDLKDYPRKGYVRYRRSHKDAPATVIRCEFELSGEEMADIETAFGPNVLNSPRVIASKGYDNRLRWEPDVDEHTFVQPWQVLEDHLSSLMPQFVYFDDYSAMRGRISVQDLAQRCSGFGRLDAADRTFMSLLSLAGMDLEDLENETNYEHLKAELESASIGISDEIFAFWNQSSDLRVDFDLSVANPNDPPPLNSGTILHIRIWNNRHRVSVPFDDRSKGFVWFFSFLSYFSTLEEEEDADLILLLDEPGLNLHAMAQRDFLRFIDNRLAPKNQVVYSTHSPFMINLDKLSSVRTVQDVDDRGTFVSDDTLSNDRETVFPIQVALGYQMAQTLFLAPHCLMVNYPSDLIYIQVLGEAVASTGQMRLDPRWVVIPVGGADNLPTFISTLGENYVSVAVMMDVSTKNRVKLDQINRNAVVKRHNPIKWVEVAKVRTADIEDLFEPTFYLKLVNEAYAGELPEPVTMKSITESNPRIVQRLDSYFRRQRIAGGRFDPYRPAALLLQRHSQLRGMISDLTVERAASLFERINSVLPTNGASEGGINAAAARVLAPIS
jgi:energy-coupling factor transporter ATP-binding protein EcfA2